MATQGGRRQCRIAMMGDRDSQKNGDARLAATALHPVAAALQPADVRRCSSCCNAASFGIRDWQWWGFAASDCIKYLMPMTAIAIMLTTLMNQKQILQLVSDNQFAMMVYSGSCNISVRSRKKGVLLVGIQRISCTGSTSSTRVVAYLQQCRWWLVVTNRVRIAIGFIIISVRTYFRALTSQTFCTNVCQLPCKFHLPQFLPSSCRYALCHMPCTVITWVPVPPRPKVLSNKLLPYVLILLYDVSDSILSAVQCLLIIALVIFVD